MGNLRGDVFGVELVFLVVDHELQPGLLEFEIHAVVFDQLLMQGRIQRVGGQREIEEGLRQDVRRAGVHGDGGAGRLALVFGRGHAEENHAAAQAHRFADRPQAAGGGARSVAGALGVDQRDFQVFAFGQLVGARGADHAAAGNHDVVLSAHGQASSVSVWKAENGKGSSGKRGRIQPTSALPVCSRRRSLQ